MSADADAHFRVQPCFTLPLATCVLEDVSSSRGIDKLKNYVRDQLLERRILLHHVTRLIADLVRQQERIQVLVGIGAETLKMADAVKQRSGDDKNVFGLDQRHAIPFKGRIEFLLGGFPVGLFLLEIEDYKSELLLITLSLIHI